MNPEIVLIRERLAQFPPVPATDIATLRARMNAFGAARQLPDLDRVPGERITPQDIVKGRAILYLHGGGYVIGSPTSHRALAAQLAGAAGAATYLIDYR